VSRIEAIMAEGAGRTDRNTPRLQQRRPRLPWSTRETDRLVELWKRYGNNWVRIKDKDEETVAPVLGNRSILDLKDKMRSVKIALMR
jgi:hypothetical protein